MIDSRVSVQEFEREINSLYLKIDEGHKESLKRTSNNISSKELNHLAQMIGK